MNSISVLETEKLIFRDISLSDADAIFQYASDENVTKYVAWERHRTINDTLDFINSAIKKYNAGIYCDWAITLKKNNSVIGTCGFRNYKRESHNAEIGYVISKNYWNMGIATEAANEMIKYGFKHLNLIRIQAACFSENSASERVMQNCGMTFEGILRKRFYKDGTYYDIKVYSILRDEYKL